MKERLAQYPNFFLHTGDCFLGVRPTVVSTVLGSCVAVTLFSRRLGMGAICHAFLPTVAGSRYSSIDEEPQPCRFVDSALERMFLSMERLGAKPKEMEIKVFGGAAGYATGIGPETGLSMGPKNVAQVDQELERRGLHPQVRDVGGPRGRKIFFLTSTGEIWLKRLQTMEPRDIGLGDFNGERL